MNDFEQSFRKLSQQMQTDFARKGMKQAGLLLMRDAVMAVPMVPLDEGTLKGSGSAFVDNALVGTSEDMAGGGSPTPMTSLGEALTPGHVMATVTFNTAYAARMHEGVEYNFQHSGHGAKFLEQKLAERGDMYIAAVRDAIEQEMRNAAA